jgi:hypothetical protein
MNNSGLHEIKPVRHRSDRFFLVPTLLVPKALIYGQQLRVVQPVHNKRYIKDVRFASD